MLASRHTFFSLIPPQIPKNRKDRDDNPDAKQTNAKAQGRLADNTIFARNGNEAESKNADPGLGPGLSHSDV